MKQIKLLLCCREDEREKLEKQAEMIYRELVEIVHTPEENPDRVFAVLPVDDSIRQQIKKARPYGSGICYVTDQFLPVGLYEKLLEEP